MAKFAAVHFPEFLKTVAAYNDGGSLATALENAFLGFDATLVTDDVKKQLTVLAASGEKADEAEENDEESTSVLLSVTKLYDNAIVCLYICAFLFSPFCWFVHRIT